MNIKKELCYYIKDDKSKKNKIKRFINIGDKENYYNY